jgi:hypothetical protein
MHWLLIGAALISGAIGFCTAIVHLIIDLLRVVDETGQSPASNDESYTLAALDDVKSIVVGPSKVSTRHCK